MAFATPNCLIQRSIRYFLLLEVFPKLRSIVSFETRVMYPHLPIFIAIIESFKEVKNKPTNQNQLVDFFF